MTDRAETLPAVDALLEERDALHAWLAKLGASTATAPASVRERVRVDYQQRLERVTDNLRAHASTIADRLAADQAEHGDLVARATSAREALTEAELRYAVGEYDAARFEAERVRHTSDLESYELSVGAVVERITSMEELQDQLTAAPAPASSRGAAAAPAPPPEEERGRDPVDIAALAPETEPEAEPVERAEEPADEDALDTDSILSVFGEAPDRKTAPEGGTASMDAAPLSFTPSGAAPSGPPLGMPAADPPRFSAPKRGGPPPPPTSSATTEPAVTPLFATDMVPSVDETEDPLVRAATSSGESIARTVRCGECGAMNRPLEWYCEKCGAELTAL